MTSALGYLDRRIAANPALSRRILSLDWEVKVPNSILKSLIIGSKRRVSIRFSQGLGDDAVLLGTADAETLGVPVNLDSETLLGSRSTEVALPEQLVEQLRLTFKEVSSVYDPIFLRFQCRDGYLAVAPWESAVERCLDVPVLRLPYFALATRPLLNPRIAVILDSADSNFSETTAYLTCWIQHFQYFSYYRNGDQSAPHVELFGTPDQIARMSSAVRSAPGQNDLSNLANLHPWPEDVARASEASRSAVRHPLLRWISDEVGNIPIDYVFIACPANVRRSRGALHLLGAVPEKVSNPAAPWSPWVEAEELSSFLMQLGAWGQPS